MSLGNPADLLDAATSLRARQLLHRPRRLVPPAALAAGIREVDPPRWRPLARDCGRVSAPQSGPTPPPHETGSFCAIGIERDADDHSAWLPTDGSDLLFAFTTQSFDELARYVAGERSSTGDAFWSRQLERWLERFGGPVRVAWHPYPLSRRLVAWMAALSAGDWPPDLQRRVLRNSYRQLRYLRRSIEHDIGGNHVLENACALVIAGACLGDDRGFRHGVRLLLKSLDEQILGDGGHEERSPSYHRALVERVSGANAVLRGMASGQAGLVDERLARMEAFMASLAGPNGLLPLFNDAWDGPPLAARSQELTVLGATGYICLRHGRDQAVLDVGPLCPPHLPPHAHADALSFVFWGDGKPLVVDPGAGTYNDPVRTWARATATHNTVGVDGEDQCHFLGTFRAARLPEVEFDPPETRDGVVVVRARHNGYRRLADPVVHHRAFVWLPGDGLVVADRLACHRAHDVASTLHLGEDRPRGWQIRSLRRSSAACETGRVAPFLGAFREADVLRQAGTIEPGEVFGWAVLRDGVAPRIDGSTLTISRSNGSDVAVDL